MRSHLVDLSRGVLSNIIYWACSIAGGVVTALLLLLLAGISPLRQSLIMGCFSFLVCALVILLFVIRTDWKNKLSPEAELAQVLFAKAEKDKEIEGIKVSHTNELRLIDGRRVIARKDQLEAEQKLYRFVLDLAVNIEEDALAIRPLLAAEETIYAAIRDSKLVQYDGKDKLARRVYLKLPYYESLKDRIDMSAMPKLPTGLDLDARLREERQYLSRKISDLAAAEPS